MGPGGERLMACEGFIDLGASFANESFVEGLTCTYVDGTGIGLVGVGLFVWAAVSGAIWIRTGSTAIPAVLAVLVGNAVLVQLAPGALAIVALAILNVFALGVTLLIRRAVS